ncbi:hypothetical protein CBS101457_004899 [Exobasidium rhododendri]|nr:hypothetical protein CBS101457_004899 [Exobasidium rhododendri]
MWIPDSSTGQYDLVDNPAYDVAQWQELDVSFNAAASRAGNAEAAGQDTNRCRSLLSSLPLWTYISRRDAGYAPYEIIEVLTLGLFPGLLDMLVLGVFGVLAWLIALVFSPDQPLAMEESIRGVKPPSSSSGYGALRYFAGTYNFRRETQVTRSQRLLSSSALADFDGGDENKRETITFTALKYIFGRFEWFSLTQIEKSLA